MKKHKIIIFLILTVSLFGEDTELNIDKSKPNLIKFLSETTIEDFEGITDYIDGYLYWEGDDMSTKSVLYFEVDLNTIDTGIGLRNRHMQDNYLETNKYQFTSYSGKITNAKKISTNEYEVIADGDMNIHGVNQKKTITGVIKIEKGIYRITTTFQVKLSDYNIEIPSLMFMKINEVMVLNLDFYMKIIPKN